MKKQLLSFGCAFRGFWYAILHEGHIRFHIVAAAYVIFFGLRFFALSRGEWVALSVLISLVMAFECMNTALERLCDKVSPRYDPLIKAAKDLSAGAVLLCALGAVAVALIVFWDIPTFVAIFNYYSAHIIELILLLISAAVSVLFIMLTPRLFKIQKPHEP